MPDFYSPDQRSLQQQFESVPLADRLQQAIIHAEIAANHKAFIESRDMFFLASVDPTGQPTCSYKGGDPGFVRVPDPKTLVFPAYDGNGMFLSLGNISATHQVGMLFIDLEQPHRLRVQGSASFRRDDPLMANYPEALGIVRVAVSAIFVNCPRYIHRYQKIQQSRYVPRANCETPYATWKRVDMLQDVLPPRDQGKAAEHGGVLTAEQYGEKLSKGEA